jgi:predicted lactoylglutathione lyase
MSKNNILKNNIHPASPILYATNLKESLNYYTKVLGFEIDWTYDDNYASVSRGQCNIMLCERGQGNPGSWVWIGVGNIIPLYNELLKANAKIKLPPTNYPWAYEFQIQDPDGNVLRFGSDPLKD